MPQQCFVYTLFILFLLAWHKREWQRFSRCRAVFPERHKYAFPRMLVLLQTMCWLLTTCTCYLLYLMRCIELLCGQSMIDDSLIRWWGYLTENDEMTGYQKICCKFLRFLKAFNKRRKMERALAACYFKDVTLLALGEFFFSVNRNCPYKQSTTSGGYALLASPWCIRGCFCYFNLLCWESGWQSGSFLAVLLWRPMFDSGSVLKWIGFSVPTWFHGFYSEYYLWGFPPTSKTVSPHHLSIQVSSSLRATMPGALLRNQWFHHQI